MRALLAVGVIVFFMLVLADHFLATRPQTNPTQITLVNRYESGRALYQIHCQTCHGKKGDGLGTFSGLNEKTPRVDFTAPGFVRTRQELRTVIMEGGAKTGKDPLMPAWKTLLNDQEIDQLAFFIQTVNREGGIRKRGKALAAETR